MNMIFGEGDFQTQNLIASKQYFPGLKVTWLILPERPGKLGGNAGELIKARAN